MPIRIYSLAKQLKIDNKVLVDICTKIGIAGKGSALASLSDEEAAQVKDYLSGKKGPTVAPAAEHAAGARSQEGATLRREDYLTPAGSSPKKVPVLGRKPGRPSAPAEKERVTDEGEPGPKPSEKEKERDREKERAVPAIKLAPMPAVQQPQAPSKPEEPAPQRPDIKLPPDAIRASKAGGKPLQEHLRKQEQKRQAGPSRKSAAGRKDAVVEPGEVLGPPVPAKERDRGRRIKETRTEAVVEEEGSVTLGGREQRQLKRKRVATARRRPEDEEEDRPAARQPRRMRRVGTSTTAPRKSNVVLQLPCTVKSFSEAMGIPAQQVLGKLLELGSVGNINSNLNAEIAELLAVSLGVEVNFRHEVTLEEKLLSSMDREDDPALWSRGLQ